jgi:hypothetical protein
MGNVYFHPSSIAEIERRARHDIAKEKRYRLSRNRPAYRLPHIAVARGRRV